MDQNSYILLLFGRWREKIGWLVNFPKLDTGEWPENQILIPEWTYFYPTYLVANL